MKWLLNLIAVSGLIAVTLYPLLTLGGGSAFNWWFELGFLASGAGALCLLVRFRKSL